METKHNLSKYLFKPSLSIQYTVYTVWMALPFQAPAPVNTSVTAQSAAPQLFEDKKNFYSHPVGKKSEIALIRGEDSTLCRFLCRLSVSHKLPVCHLKVVIALFCLFGAHPLWQL